MIIKKFQAGTENEAMELAKAELGGDAIVMNIKTIKPKGIYKMFRKPSVEVTAAVDENPVYHGTAANRDAIRAAAHNSSAERFADSLSASGTAADRSAGGLAAEEESAIEKRLNNLQELLEKQVAAAGTGKAEEEEISAEEKEPDAEAVKTSAAGKRVACIQLIYNQLVKNEVDEKYAGQLVSEIESSLKRDASVDHILGAVYQKIILKLGQPSLLDFGGSKTKYVFFIGPTGVGKTTTIAKIASSLKLNRKANLAMLTADTYRIAAVEQLRTYADILGIPLKVVYSAEEVAEAKRELENFDLVLVDTAGRSHRSKEQCEDIRRLIDVVPEEDREIYLVLSATTKYRDLIRIAEAYKEISNFRLIFTKLDETSSIGNLFNIRMLTEAPLSYTTWGQNVPDDIGKVDAQQIAKQLLGGGE